MKTNYEELKAAKIERAQELAAKNSQLSIDLFNQSSKMADVIPFGQPILVGHHSEQRDRNYRSKIWNTMDKAVKTGDKAKYYEAKAERIENNTAINSDDPEAIVKIDNKLEGLIKTQELYKAINKIIKGKGTQEDKEAALQQLGLKETTVKALFVPDYCGRIGIPDYKITNNGANIRRLKQRGESIAKVEAMPESEKQINGATLKVCPNDNRVKIIFDGIPAEEVRTNLKRHGFHWSRYEMAWMRKISNGAIWDAQNILQDIQRTVPGNSGHVQS